MMPTISIIVVNYNAGDWLQRSIRSAFDYSSADIYVVDNDSTDDSLVRAQSEFTDQPRIHWQLNSENRGFAAANNQVLQTLETDFAVLMNPDCEINQHTLAPILEQFSLNPRLGLASCKIVDEHGALQSTCRRRFPTPWSALVRMLMLDKLFPSNPKFGNFDYGDDVSTESGVELIEAISGAFMVVRGTALKEIGLLDEAYFMHCEDLDWCYRFGQQQWLVGFVPAASVVHAKGVSSQSRPIRVLWTLHQGMNRFFDKFYTQQYGWPLRLLVKAGIYTSFAVRALGALLFRSNK